VIGAGDSRPDRVFAPFSGALCEWYSAPCDDEWKADVVRKLKRLQEWTDHFGLRTCLPEVIAYVESGPHSDPLVIAAD
jgi:hypothetical protein